MSEQQDAYDQEADSYGSWRLAIEELKRRHEQRLLDLEDWCLMIYGYTYPHWNSQK